MRRPPSGAGRHVPGAGRPDESGGSAVRPLSGIHFQKLSPDRLAELLEGTEAIPTELGCNWLLDILDEHAELSSTVARVLAAMPGRAGEVMDVIIPVPSWQFTNSAVQPLHSWSIPEYGLRMKERLAQNSRQKTGKPSLWPGADVVESPYHPFMVEMDEGLVNVRIQRFLMRHQQQRI